MTSAGYLTEPHLDFYGVPSLIIHVFGVKVWLVWPATDENLGAVCENLINPAQHEKLTIAVALSKLKGLKIVRCTRPGQSFVIEPFAIHAVISQTICGHHGKTFTNFSRFNDFRRSFTFYVDRAIKFCHRAGMSQIEQRRTLEMLQVYDKVLTHWRHLLEVYPSHPHASEYTAALDDLALKIESERRRLELFVGKLKRETVLPTAPSKGKRTTKKRKTTR